MTTTIAWPQSTTISLRLEEHPRDKVIYIAGPYRAPSEWEVIQNIRRAEEAALFVWKHRGIALCPHKNTAGFGGALPDKVWLEGDLELLARCNAVWAIEGWEASEGANAEVRFAMMQIPVFYSSYQVIEYLKR